MANQSIDANPGRTARVIGIGVFVLAALFVAGYMTLALASAQASGVSNDALYVSVYR